MKTRFAAQKTTGIALIFMLIFFLQGYSFCQDKQNPLTKPSEKSQTLTSANGRHQNHFVQVRCIKVDGRRCQGNP